MSGIRLVACESHYYISPNCIAPGVDLMKGSKHLGAKLFQVERFITILFLVNKVIHLAFNVESLVKAV